VSAAAGVPERVGAEGWKRLAESQQALAQADQRTKEIGAKYGLDASGVSAADGQTIPSHTPPGQS
jgi:hypothetical protein